MSYVLLADGIVVLHLGFVAFVIAGGFLAWRWPQIMWGHVPAALWGILVEAAGLTCPLTPLEQWLRQQSGHPIASDDFVDRYLLPILYPEGLTRTVQLLLALVVVIVNAFAYARIWKSHFASHSSHTPPHQRP